jgi:hypothetical protein
LDIAAASSWWACRVSSSPLQRFSAKPFALDAACGARPLSA